MAQLVNLPDGSQASFPDGTPPDVMTAAIQKRFPPQAAPAPQAADSPPAGAVPGSREYADWAAARARGGNALPQVTNSPQTQYDFAVQKIKSDYGLNDDQVGRLKQSFDPSLWNLARAGTTFGLSDELSGASAGLADMLMGKNPSIGYGDFSNLQNKTLDLAREKNGMLGSAVEFGTGMASMGPEKAALDAVINGTKTDAPNLFKTAVTSGGTGSALGGIGGFTNTNGDVDQRLQGAAQGAGIGAATGAAAPVVARGLAALFTNDAMKTAAPSLADLKGQYDPLYKAGDNSGVSVSRAGTIQLSDHMHQIAQDAGLISPTGRIADGYPNVKHALQTFDDYAAGGSMNTDQMKTVLKTVQAAAGSADKNERAIGVPMLKAFQDFRNSGVPEYAAADPIYASAMNGKKVQAAINNAEYPGSSLNSTFSQLSKKIESGKVSGFNPDEAAAIKAVAMGGPKPGNIVTDYLHHGVLGVAGAPFKAVGNILAAGKQQKLAALASALVRSRVVPGQMSPSQQSIAQALLNSGALGPALGGQIGQQQGGPLQ